MQEDGEEGLWQERKERAVMQRDSHCRGGRWKADGEGGIHAGGAEVCFVAQRKW